MSLIKGLVSVIIPVYNGASTISRAIRSLLFQSYTNWECIIINDGCTDNTLEVVDEYLKQDYRIKIFSFNKNKGRPYARQKGLELAKGEFLAMLDCDDFYHPEKIQYQIDCFHNDTDISLVSCGLYSFGEKVNFITKRKCSQQGKIIYKGKINITHAPSMLKTEIAKKIRYNSDLKLGEDVDFMSRYLSINDYMYISAECLYFYSEFDSVSLDKIKQTYLNELRVSLLSFKIKSIKILAKLIFSYIYHSFYDLNSILKRRGILAPEDEYIVFLELLNRLK